MESRVSVCSSTLRAFSAGRPRRLVHSPKEFIDELLATDRIDVHGLFFPLSSSVKPQSSRFPQSPPRASQNPWPQVKPKTFYFRKSSLSQATSKFMEDPRPRRLLTKPPFGEESLKGHKKLDTCTKWGNWLQQRHVCLARL